eukprot:Skav203275  [mRNA]  locus=scaffold324:69997:74020:- [translate_table: standard]
MPPSKSQSAKPFSQDDKRELLRFMYQTSAKGTGKSYQDWLAEWRRCMAHSQSCAGKMALAPATVDAVKGWTRCSCVAFIALMVSELDPTDKAIQDLLIALGMGKDEQTFRNLSLSYRGSERQAPNVLQMALRFSKVMERQASTMSGNTEGRLHKVIVQFNQSPGLHVKHQVDGDKERTILNLIIGTCKALLIAVIDVLLACVAADMLLCLH